jgi:hypothetical protein
MDAKELIQNLKLQSVEHDKNKEQKDKIVKILELKLEEYERDLQKKKRQIQSLELQYEIIIKNIEQKVKLSKNRNGILVCPAYGCKENIPKEEMGEHLTSCMCSRSDKSYLQLNTEVSIHISAFDHPTYWVYMLKDSRDLFKLQLSCKQEKMRLRTGRWTWRWQYHVLILHHSVEDTQDQYCYSFKYLHDGNSKESGTVRCAPVGLSREDANNYSYTSDFFLNSDYYSVEHKVSVKLFKA